MKYERANITTLNIIKEQLSREPRGVLGVTTACVHRRPQVIINRPVSTSDSEVEIFPTLYWLTCPYLKKEISLLEGDGLIVQFEQRMKDDPGFAAQMEANHRAYAKRRLSLVPSEVQERIRTEYPERFLVLAEAGVGGIRSPEGVKCLHTHVADFLAAGENVIGRDVVALINKPLSCESGRCEDYK